MKTFVVNSEKNDDWIRSLPGYKNEVKVIESLKISKPVAKKGGIGSGHHGHSGRIGKVGGSIPGSSAASTVSSMTWYHRTDNADNILENGFTKFSNGLFGRGAYFTSKSGKGSKSGVLEVSVHPKNTLMTTYIGFPKLYEELTGDTYSGGNSEEHKKLMKLGYDSVFVTDVDENEQWLVIFNPKNSIDFVTEEKQLPIDDDSMRKLLDVRINIFYNESDGLVEQLFDGNISIGEWEESMKSLIRGLHTSSAAIGKGGWDNMTFQDWGRLGTPLRQQYRWLHNFAEYISENRNTVSLAAIRARARLYGKAAGASAALMQAGMDIASMLPWIPRDGSTECLNGCHCGWVLTVIDETNTSVIVQAVWRLSEAEHCTTCVDRRGHVEVIEVPRGTVIPKTIGFF